MEYPGSNELRLCYATIRALLQEQLNSGRAVDQSPIRVINIDSRDHTIIATITTDEEKS